MDEFKVLQGFAREGTEPFERQLNSAGDEGYVLAGLANMGDSVVAVLRRQKPTEAAPFVSY